MTKSLILGAVLGGVTAFAWSMVSHEVLGWHEKVVTGFQNEDEVSAAITAHAPADGTYLLPIMPRTEGMSADQRKKAEAAAMEKYQKGPIMFAAVRRGGFNSFGQALGLQLLSQMTAALLLTWLLLQSTGLSYARRVAFLAVAGLTASVLVDLPNWIWWGFSGAYTAVNLADSTITWAIAGLVIAKVAGPQLSVSKR